MAEENRAAASAQEIESGGESLEYVASSVPDSKRKSLISLTFVLAGYPIALSNFVIGGKVGVGLTFGDAISALLVGNAFLILIVILTGLLAFRTGLSTSFLSRRVFGISGSAIFSVLLALSAVTWVSANGDIFARMIPATFSWWPLSVPITAVLVILMWMQSAVRGYKGLQFVSYLGVPAAIVMAVWGVGAMLRVHPLSDLTNYIPAEPITFASATSQIVGGWIFGAVITPDVCRYAKSRAHVVFAGFIAFLLGCFGLQFAGALVAIATGTGDFIVAMAGLGLIVVAFICAIFCLWTT
ncbi:MAG: cytosine permease [Planctomycetaceae bacterium]|nr:cytosine permease [Planctomycetaceae bacterium]